LACDYLFVEPRGKVFPLDPRNLIATILYLFCCTAIIGFGEALRVTRRYADPQRESLWITLTAMLPACRAHLRVEQLESRQLLNNGGNLGSIAGLTDTPSERFVTQLYYDLAAVSRRRLGELLGGESGRAIVADADSWMADQQIVNPIRTTAMYAPGFLVHKSNS
jgi:hypothetical protein